MKSGDIFGHKMPQRAYEPLAEIWVLPRDYFGLEYEVEHYSHALVEALAYFKLKPDGSLRDAGAEFVLMEPMFGKDLWNAICAFEDSAKKYGYTFGERTSTHVHLDARDLDQKELYKLAILYAVFEKPLFNFCNRYSAIRRDSSNFCVPWFRSPAYFEYIKALESGSQHSVRAAVARMERYAALNYAALTDHGSVEFRHLGGCPDREVIRRWVNLIMCLKKAAKEYNAEGYDLIQRISVQGFDTFTESIFGERLEITPRDMRDGILVAQDLLTAGTFLDWENPILKQASKDKVGLGEKFVEMKKREKEKKEEGPDLEDQVPAPPNINMEQVIAMRARLAARNRVQINAPPQYQVFNGVEVGNGGPVAVGNIAGNQVQWVNALGQIPPDPEVNILPRAILALDGGWIDPAPALHAAPGLGRYNVPDRLRGMAGFNPVHAPGNLSTMYGVQDPATGRYHIPGIGIFNHRGDRIY